MNAEVLKYLRNKFPSVDEKAFFTDYAGDVHEKIIGAEAINDEIITQSYCFCLSGRVAGGIF